MVSEDDVKKIAKLAHLLVRPDEIARLTNEFNAILEYVGQLDRIDVTDVPPMSHAHGTNNVFREDKVVPLLSTEEALSNAPDRSGNFVRVPLVIEDE